MKELKFKFDLSTKVSIYVPSTYNVDEAVNNEHQVKRVMEALCGWFGGATASDAKGGWMSTDKGLVIEDVKIVYAYCKEDQLRNNFDALIRLCQDLCKEMQQDAIALEVNGQMAFIER